MKRVHVKSEKPRPLAGINRSANSSKAMLEKLNLSGGDRPQVSSAVPRISQAASSMETYAALVSPDVATAMLDDAKDLINHRVGLQAVRRFASDIVSDRWEYPAQPIIVDAHGVLLDGRHRLWAVIESGRTVKFVVLRMLNIKTPEDRIRILASGRCPEEFRQCGTLHEHPRDQAVHEERGERSDPVLAVMRNACSTECAVRHDEPLRLVVAVDRYWNGIRHGSLTP